MRRFTTLLSSILSVVIVAGCSTTPIPFDERITRQVVFTVAGPDKTSTLATSFSSRPEARSSNGDYSSVDLGFRIGRIIQFHRLTKISQWSIKALGIEAIVAEIRGDRSVEQVMKALAEDHRVDSVQAVSTYDLLTYNDPYFYLQAASVKGAGIERVHSLATGKDVVVGLVDTGVDRQHPEIADRIIMSANFVEHDRKRFDNDEHGTSVAGVIGSAANNDLGIVGVAPESKLMIFKACWQDDRTGNSKCDSFSIIKALNEVLAQQPDILNLSLAGPADPLIARLLRAASDRGIIIMAAVDGTKASSFPAVMPEVIAVSAPAPANSSMPAHTILAPGIDILTTTPGSTYAFRSGSSMSTAYVSGIAALMKEREPMMSGEQLRARLLSSSRHGIDMIPIVDVCQAVVGPDNDLCSLDSIVVVTEVSECENCLESM
ncbi:MAG: S8 family serine peptidase [Pseudomonadales bacterium]